MNSFTLSVIDPKIEFVIPCLTEPAPFLIRGNPEVFKSMDSGFRRNDEPGDIFVSVCELMLVIG